MVTFMKINPNIFKAYDIRGIYPEDINEETVYNIGRSIAVHTKAENIVVGKDIRLSSDSLEKELIKGLKDQGINVIKLGFSTSPMLYYATGLLSVEAGIMITASHNPKNYNGLKICKQFAVPVGEGSGMEEIKALAINGIFPKSATKGRVSENQDFKNQYFRHIGRFFNIPSNGKKIKIVFDFANAMGILDKPVFAKLKNYIESVYLYDNYDGNFPNHEANPLNTSTLESLQEKVLEIGADFGVSYDGDADRVGFIDEKGHTIPMDYITALIAGEILKKHKGALVLVDLRSSNAVIEYIKKAGGKTGLCRVGHSLIKKQMRDEKAVFAGELSGHYYFDENYKAELSSLAVIMIINLINESGKTLSELSKPLKKYHHSGEINSKVESTKEVIFKLKNKYADGKINELDGVRIDFEDWWFNVRASNTEPVIRLNLEAKTNKQMEAKVEEVLDIIRS